MELDHLLVGFRDEGMLLPDPNVDLFHGTEADYNDVLAILLGLEGIDKVEAHVAVLERQLKPLAVMARVRIRLAEDPVSAGSIVVVVEHEPLLLDGLLWLELHGQVGHNHKVLGGDEIVDHPRASDWQLSSELQVPLGIEKAVVDEGLLWIVSKSHQLTSLSVDFGMSRDLVLQSSVEVVKALTENVEHMLVSFGFDLEWKVVFDQGENAIGVVHKSRVGDRVLEWTVASPLLVADLDLQLIEQVLVETRAPHLSESHVHWLSSLDLIKQLRRLGPPVAVLGLSFGQLDGMDHAISLKPVDSHGLLKEFLVRSVSEVDSVDVGRNLAFNYRGLLNGVPGLFLGASEVPFERVVHRVVVVEVV